METAKECEVKQIAGDQAEIITDGSGIVEEIDEIENHRYISV